MELKDKVIAITGGASAWGKHQQDILYPRGAKVMIRKY